LAVNPTPNLRTILHVTLEFTDGYGIRFIAGAILEVNSRQNTAATSGVNIGVRLGFSLGVRSKVEPGVGFRLNLTALSELQPQALRQRAT